MAFLYIIGACWAASCPDAQVIAPCTCTKNDIFCSKEATDLAPIFARLSEELDGQNKKLESLTIMWSGVQEFTADLFQDIDFDTILLRANYELRRVHQDAFKHMSTVSVTMEANTKLGAEQQDAEDLFKALDQMRSLKSLDLTSNGFTKIPDNAFPLVQESLQDAIVSGQAIHDVGIAPFIHLTNLTFLAIHNSGVRHFPAGSLDLNNKNKVDLRLVDNNWITGESFADNWIRQNTRYPVILRILYNKARSQLTYLDQSKFEPFLDQNNQNSVETYGLDCSDCRNAWIVRKNLTDGFDGKVVTSWKSCQDYSDPKFAHCQ